ncbi:TetR/AcrR family transcriptional regulator [Mycobacterium hodleri]|uniref:TetR/AcrR family transcriptional regulator n=1 Tax=Mycolicibacterium hodleri TaxID=49897 RepID=A0A544VR00_9MYCO|nr:TetR/AcrR family transcriptional regulator [Mycolicibacterium hodleri]
MTVNTSSAPASTTALPSEDVHESFRHRALDEFARQFDSSQRSSMSPAKRRVLEAFLKLCVSHGMDSVSMRDLAKELDIKAPSIYTHFAGGRDEIISESMRWHYHQFCQALLDAVDTAADASEFWDAMVRLHFTRQVQLPESDLWDLIAATDRTAHVLPAELSAKVTAWVDAYEALYVSAALDMGIADTARRVKMVMTVLEGSSRWFGSEHSSRRAVKAGADQAVLVTRRILELPIT